MASIPGTVTWLVGELLGELIASQPQVLGSQHIPSVALLLSLKEKQII